MTVCLQPDVLQPDNLDAVQRFDILLEAVSRPGPGSATNSTMEQRVEARGGAGSSSRGAAGEEARGVESAAAGEGGGGVGGYGAPKAQARALTAGELARQQVFGHMQQEQQEQQGQEETQGKGQQREQREQQERPATSEEVGTGA